MQITYGDLSSLDARHRLKSIRETPPPETSVKLRRARIVRHTCCYHIIASEELLRREHFFLKQKARKSKKIAYLNTMGQLFKQSLT